MLKTRFFRLATAALLATTILASGCARRHVQISRLAPPRYDIRAGQRLAVLPFSGTYNRDDAGEIVANALVSHLAPVGYYKLIERARIKAVMDEQTFSRSDYVDPSTASRFGEIIGAEYLIVGTVTAWSVEDTRTTEYRTEYRETGYYHPDGSPVYEEIRVPVDVVIRRGTVAADFRMIDANDGTIIASSSESESFQSRAAGSNAIAQLPPVEQVLRNLAQIVARKFFEKISAHPVTEGRVLFKGKTPASKQGVQFAENGLWEEAKAQWQRAIQERPEDFAPYNNMGVALEREGRYDEAENFYQQALARNPGNTDVQQQLQAVRRVRAEMGRLRQNQAPPRQ